MEKPYLNRVHVTLSTIALLLGPLAMGQTLPQPKETLPGFKADQVYDAGGVDHVNIYNGDPQVVIPIGPEYPLGPDRTWQLKAHYSARFWHIATYTDCGGNDGCSPVTRRAQVNGYPTLGAGWTLSVGYIDPGNLEAPYPAMSPAYHSPDGGVLPLTGPYVDGSYRPDPPAKFKVDSKGGSSPYYVLTQPDGTILEFDQRYTQPVLGNGFDFSDRDRHLQGGTRYGLTAIRSPFKDAHGFNELLLQVFYRPENPSAGSWGWQIDHIDLVGSRRIDFHWGSYTGVPGGSTWPVLRSVTFPVSQSQPLDVGFSHHTDGRMQIISLEPLADDYCRKGPVRTSAAFPSGLTDVPLLKSITQSSLVHSFEYNRSGDPLRSNRPDGSLAAIRVPTGGVVEYAYDSSTVGSPCVIGQGSNCGSPENDDGGTALPSVEAQCVPGVCRKVARFQAFMDTAPAVTTRSEKSAAGTTLSTTTYFRKQFAEADLSDGCAQPSAEQIVRQVIVRRNDGNVDSQGIPTSVATKHIFTTGPNGYPGLEVHRRYYETATASASPFRSVVYCHGDPAGGWTGFVCGGRGADGKLAVQGDIPPGMLAREVTWYGVSPAPANAGVCSLSGIPPCIQVERSGFNRDAGEFQTETHTTNAGITNQAGWSSRTTTTTWTPNLASWQLKLYSSRTTADAGSVPVPAGATTAYDFDGATGFLKGATIRETAGATVLNTRTWTLSADLSGNPIQEDVSLSGTIQRRAGDVTRTTRTFQYGQLLTSQRSGMSWLSFNVSRHPSTGLITSSFDPNGLATGYDYDGLGRLWRITPPGGEASSVITYDSPTKVTMTRDGGGGNSTWERYLYDDFGRLVREIRKMPAGYAFKYRTFRAGLKTFESEWAKCSGADTDCALSTAPGTEYSGFDPFGRPRGLKRADATTTTFNFTDGAILHSDTLESVTIDNVSGVPSTTMTRKDALGRVIEVTEPDVDDGTDRITSNRYNVLDRLAEVTQREWPGENPARQVRTFAYDVFGFLRSETHPERTAAYTKFSPLGTPVEKSEGSVVFGYALDALDRVRTIDAKRNWPTGGDSKFLLYNENCYDGAVWTNGVGCSGNPGAGDYALGRLSERVGFNPLDAASSVVRDRYSYRNGAGRLSRQTTISGPDATSPQLPQDFTYNALGQVVEHRHHRLAEGDGRFVVTTGYSAGLPTSLTASVSGTPTSLVSAVGYHPSGALASYTFGNGVVTTIEQASSGIARPHRISTTNAAVNFDSGFYSYDGAGNVLAIGSDSFTYDRRSRLKSSRLKDDSQVFRDDRFDYDRFGNLKSRWADGLQILLTTDTSTNRLTGASFDPAGNQMAYGLVTSTYDGLARQTQMAVQRGVIENYLYDAAGERFRRAMAASWAPPVSRTSFFTLPPCRLLDTRQAGSPTNGLPLSAQTVLTFPAAGRCGIPSTAASLSVNVTYVTPTSDGELKVYPSGIPSPPSGTVTPLRAGLVRATQSIVALDGSTSGRFSLFSTQPPGGSTHVIVDVNGYFAAPALSGLVYFYTLRDPQNRLSTEYRSDALRTYVTRDHVYLGNLLVASYVPPGAQGPGTQSGFLFHSSDHLGTPRLVTNWQRETVARYKYRPYGQLLSSQDPGQGPDFAAMEKDLASQTHYDHARFYQAWTGRFNGVDQLNGQPHDPQGWNRYSYAKANPLKYVDPDGRATKFAEAVAKVLESAGSGIRSFGASLNGGGSAGIAMDAGLATVGDIVGGLGDMFRVGDALGEALGSGGGGEEVLRGAAADLGRGSALALTLALPASSALRGGSAAVGEVSTLRPGPFATDSIPARSPAPSFTAAERAKVRSIGETSGCHTCGTMNPGTKSGNFVLDHQPPSALIKPGQTQRLFPQCTACSFPRQANEVRHELRLINESR